MYLYYNGTFVNTSRRVQLVNKAVDPPGDAMGDMEIICQLATNSGTKGFEYRNAEEVWDEIRQVNANQFGGMSFKRLRETNGLFAPCPDLDHPGTPCLYKGSIFNTPEKKAVLVPVVFTPEFSKREECAEIWKKKLCLPQGYPFTAGSIIEKASTPRQGVPF